MKFHWILMLIFPVLALAGCGAVQESARQSQPQLATDTDMFTPVSAGGTDTPATEVTTAVTTSPIAESSAWDPYHNSQAGYSAEYPPDWTVNEQIGTDGFSTTTFSATDGSAGITVLVQSGEFGGAGSLDLPNTRCEEVTVGGLTGTRCFDTLSSSTSTAIVSQGKTYIITSTSKRLDAMIYDRFLASFQFSP